MLQDYPNKLSQQYLLDPNIGQVIIDPNTGQRKKSIRTAIDMLASWKSYLSIFIAIRIPQCAYCYDVETKRAKHAA